MGQSESSEDCCIISDKQLFEEDLQKLEEINTNLNNQKLLNNNTATPSTSRFSVNQSPSTIKQNDDNMQTTYKEIQGLHKLSQNLSSTIYENDRIRKLAEIVQFAPKLVLTVLSSSTLPMGLTININAQGIVNGLRNANDGYCYFGSKKRIERSSPNVKQIEIVNDFIIPSLDPEVNKRNRGRHFQIEFHIISNQYRIRDLNVGFGCFKKIDCPIYLKNRQLINIGNIFVIAYLIDNNLQMMIPRNNQQNASNYSTSCDNTYQFTQFQKNKDIALKLQFFGGACKGEEYVTIPEPNKIMTIGRSHDCSLQFEDNLLSKIQCTIDYDLVNGWVFRDGNGTRPSTNGSWLHLSDEQTLYSGFVFKTNQTIFEALLV